jgi:dihydroorotate dehydrogenase electron transfer subunit
VGPETRLFPRLSPGALVRVTGPLGRIRPEIANPDPERPLILVAGGAGLGPMGMFKALRATAAPKAPGAPKAAGAPKGPDSPGGPPLTLIYGERTGAAQIDRGYLGGLADRVIPFTDDGTGYGEKGLASQGLRRLLDEKGPPPRVFACGPQGLLRELSGIASAKGAELYVSAEAFMACGLGVCLSCSSEAGPGGRVLLCRDGPVFAAPELRL